MKLARVKVEYTCGLTLVDKVSLDVATGTVSIPPRLARLMSVMEANECSPAFTMEYEGYSLPVTVESGGRYCVTLPSRNGPLARQLWDSVTFPTKDQRQQNGRLLHTFSAASVVGAFGYVHAVTRWDTLSVFTAVSLVVLGVLLWYVGFLHMKGE
ncbi:hypothetical protein B0G84_7613 [Paraburkholderia sp. BL8N3]|nr:hypothetical protein [Paraburkholderia sp. BL8N3]TCK33394.1 hypothetical protein B0G84_7613 [Paraburkholderia sp. BL8N3]